MINALLPQTVQYEPRLSVDKYNKPTYGTAVSLKAREEKTVQLVGEQELAQTTIVFVENNGTTITAEGRITLSDGAFPILAVRPELDKFGNIHHYKLWVGRTRLLSAS